MGSHSKTRSHEAAVGAEHHPRARRSLLGRHAVAGHAGHEVRDRHSDRLTAAERAEIARWHDLNEEVTADRERVKGLKNTYEAGVETLVKHGSFHPQIRDTLPSVRMIPIIEGIEEDDPDAPVLDDFDGFMMVGSSGETIRDTQGRYLAVRDLDNEAIGFHEIAHVGVMIGSPDEYQIFREPIANQNARAVMNATGRDSTDLNVLYRPHEQILGTVMHESGLTAWDVTGITSGQDPIANEHLFNRVVAERVGWDMAGYTQKTYIHYIYHEQNPSNDVYWAANATQQALNLQLQAA